MKLSIAVKRILAAVLFRSGMVSKKLRSLSRDHFLILMYHRVLPREEARNGVQAGMYVEPETLVMHIRFLKKHFTIAPLSMLAASREGKPGDLSNKPTCMLTFDDGWRDFYEYAFPLLKQKRIPATVFLPTGFIGTNQWFWTDVLAHLLLEQPDGDIRERKDEMPKDPVARRILTSEGHFEQRLEKSIELLKGYKLNVVESILGDLGYKCKMNPADRDRLFLSWDELQEMAESGLISFGSHTDNHHILTTLAESEIVKELQESRDKLLAQGIVKADFIPFCCPNGNYTERIADMVKKAGYSVAVTTRRLWNRRECDPYTLKRIGIHQDMASTESLFACRVANIF